VHDGLGADIGPQVSFDVDGQLDMAPYLAPFACDADSAAHTSYGPPRSALPRW
jgi:hypothetical protein